MIHNTQNVKYAKFIYSGINNKDSMCDMAMMTMMILIMTISDWKLTISLEKS